MFEQVLSSIFSLSVWQAATLLPFILIIAEIIHAIYSGIYNVYFHPLRHFPGPTLDIAIPYIGFWRMIRGRQPANAIKQHAKYGDVVRLSAGLLSYISPEAWKDIYGGNNDLPKYIIAGAGFPEHSVFCAGKVDHARQRRALAPAFSDKALGQQEQLIQIYVDLLIQRLKETTGKPTNIVRWFNLTTFDLIGDLTFGHSLDGLELGASNQWLDNLSKQIQFIPLVVIMHFLKILGPILKLTIGSTMRRIQAKQREHVTKLTEERLTKEDRGDFMDYMIEKFSKEELVGNADILMIAGSHTSCSSIYTKVNQEVRKAFDDNNQISFKTCSELPYLHAVIEEGLRIFPPVPVAMLRQTIAPTQICGQIVPAGARLGVPHLAAYRSEKNFHQADMFIPERWIEKDNTDSPFYHDKRDVFQPFSYGPRNCIGQKLADHEIRLILSKVLWNYDLELQPECMDWQNQRAFATWELPPLQLRLLDRFGQAKY